MPCIHTDTPVTLPRVLSPSPQPSFNALATTYIAASESFSFLANHIYDDHGKRETLDSLIKKNPEIWNKALSNEWGRLAQGNIYGVLSTDTIEFIFKHEIPPGRDITYASFVCDKRPLKPEPYRVRIVVGDDCLSYGEDAASPTTDLLKQKI